MVYAITSLTLDYNTFTNQYITFWSITKDQYTKKAHEYKQRQHKIDIELKAHTVADEDYANTVKYLLELASRAHELFTSSKPQQKRQLINFVLSNLQLKEEKVLYLAKEPFNLILKSNQCNDRQGLQDIFRTTHVEGIAEYKEQIQLFRNTFNVLLLQPQAL